MSKKIGIIILTILTMGCSTSQQLIIEGKTFTTRQYIKGHEQDGIVFRNCTFKGIEKGAIKITGTSNGLIEDCHFEDIGDSASAIYLVGDTPGWTIRRCTFKNIGKNAILTDDGTTNITIEDNILNDVAKRTTGSRQHGFYIQGPGYLIQNNRVNNIHYANGISVRSTGTVRGNIVSRVGLVGNQGEKPGGACIKYYPDHPKGAEKVIIENNICYDPKDQGIFISAANDPAWRADSIVVRFNTVIKRPLPFGSPCSGIEIHEEMENKYVEVYGNLIVNLTSIEDMSVIPPYCDLATDNLVFTQNPGFFADWDNEDFHIQSDPRIVGMAKNVPSVPEFDIDQEKRSVRGSDIGADEWNENK